MLKEGKSQNKTAKEVGRSPGLVNKVAREEGLVNIQPPKNANGARRDYAQAERLALLNKGFDKAEDLLGSIGDAKELASWMIAVATGIDKRRLEDGEATHRGETIDPERRKRMRESLDEVAAQRRKSMAG